jgi:hypothetical protein
VGAQTSAGIDATAATGFVREYFNFGATLVNRTAETPEFSEIADKSINSAISAQSSFSAIQTCPQTKLLADS